MKQATKQGMIEAMRGVVIPDDGLPMTVFGEMVRAQPHEVTEVVGYLNRKRLLWMSRRGGHVRVFPESKRPPRGRPPVVEQNVADPLGVELVELLGDLVGNFLRVRRLGVDPVVGPWNAERFANDQAHNVEAEQIMRRIRRFQRKHPTIESSAIRDALWLDRPDLMARVAMSQPELERGVRPFSTPEERKRNVEANLSHDARIHAYVQRAGKNGIATYEISKRFAGALDTAQVNDIATSLENSGMIHVIEARKGGRGRMTMRLFDIQFTPEVTASGSFFVR